MDLSSPRYFIEHAKRRIKEFEREVGAFMDPNPYTEVIEPDPNGHESLFKIKLTRPLPETLPGIAFDAVNALRAALDQSGYAAARANGYTGKRTKFPFGETETYVKGLRNANGSCEGIPKEIFEVMLSFKPYEGGDTFLVALNKLCNTQKHHIVVPAVSSLESLGLYVGGPIRRADPRPLKWDPAKDEIALFYFLTSEQPEIDLKFKGYVSLGDVEGLRRRPADLALREYVALVTKIVNAIEAKAREIGLMV